MRVRVRKEARCDNVVKFYVERWDWYKPWWRYVDSASGAGAQDAAMKCANELKSPWIAKVG